jgi:outer membrane protein TolC
VTPVRLAKTFLCLALLTPTLDAQQRSVTLTEALRMAEAAAPAVIQAQGGVRSAGAQVRAAWGSFLPNVSTSASYGTSTSEQPSRVDPISGEVLGGNVSSSSVGFGANASFDLFTGFRRGSEMSSARATRRSAGASLDFERAQASLQATTRFLSALESAALVRVRQDGIRRAEEKRAIAIARLTTRAATISDSLQAEVDVAQARVQLASVIARQSEAEANLARVTGLDGRVSAVEDSTLYRQVAVPDAGALLDEAAARAPSVLRAEAQADAARAAVGISRSSYWPSLFISANTNYNGSDRGDYALFNTKGASVGLQWNLFNRFGRERQLAVSLADRDAAEARAADARREVGANLTTQLAALQAAQERIQLTSASVEAARANARVQTERYRLGSIGIVELNASQDALSRAEEEFVSARFDYLRAKAQIEAILGRQL